MDKDSKNFLYHLIRKVLFQMFEQVANQVRREFDQEREYIDLKQLAWKYSMSTKEAEANFTKDKRMQMIEKRKSTKGKRYWKSDKAIEICNEIMDDWD